MTTKANAILDKFPIPTEIANLDANLQKIVSELTFNHSVENLKLLFSFLDLTSLNSTDKPSAIAGMTEKVNAFQTKFPGMPNVAAICVYPALVPVVKQILTAPNVGIAAVTGGFPASQTFLDVKVIETYTALAKGASETDMVISIGKTLDGDLDSIYNDVEALKQVSGPAHLKVILETGALETPELIWKASILAMDAGADFIKTSTGKHQPAATLEAAYIMCLAIKAFYKATGKKVGFKPAGGIANTPVALQYASVVKSILGNDWLNNHLFRIGASSLANSVLNDVLQIENPGFAEIKYF